MSGHQGFGSDLWLEMIAVVRRLKLLIARG